MDKSQKSEYLEGIEDYLEEYKVYDYFYELMKDIILHRPKNPVDFLIERISKSECFRWVIVGPPGFSRLGLGRLVAGKIGWKYLSMTDWISKERDILKEPKVDKNAIHHEESKAKVKDASQFHVKEDAKEKEVRDCVLVPDAEHDLVNSKIHSSLEGKLSGRNRFVPDQTAISIFKKRVKEYEHESWILEGFPKTKIQALALGKNKIVPDKIFVIKYSDDVAIEHIVHNLKEKFGKEKGDVELAEMAKEQMNEYHNNLDGVLDLFHNIVHIIDAHGYVKGYKDEQNKVSIFVDQISRLILAKRMSPDKKLRIIVVGPPGSGRSTQGEMIAKQFGLIHVSTANLLKNEVRLKTEKGKRIKECFNQSKLVPDEIICTLIESRIKQNDWKLNGWVLDGFPKTIQQITVLKALKIKPTRVIILECAKEVWVDRIFYRCFDPVTGKVYHTITNPPDEQEVAERVVPYFPDMTKEKLGKRWEVWNDFKFKVEESYNDKVLKFNTEEYNSEEVRDQIIEFIQNPMF